MDLLVVRPINVRLLFLVLEKEAEVLRDSRELIELNLLVDFMNETGVLRLEKRRDDTE